MTFSTAHLPDARDRGAIGVGLKPQHVEALLGGAATLDFVEIHAENYMGAGGPPHRRLEAVRGCHALSIHGVGLSIGGAGRLDRAHLARLRALLARYEPALFSEHLAWSSHGGAFFDDLLPLPYTEETLALVCDHVDEAQDALGRRLLLENPSAYVRFAESTIPEPELLAEVARRTGCGLLLDINNVVVATANVGGDAGRYIDAFPVDAVGEIHLAGHDVVMDGTGRSLLIDAHGSAVAADTWTLYARALARTGPVPTLIERDNDVPALDALVSEATRAAGMMRAIGSHAGAGLHVAA
jgi:uncharacterized protein (UPF0276 family)